MRYTLHLVIQVFPDTRRGLLWQLLLHAVVERREEVTKGRFCRAEVAPTRRRAWASVMARFSIGYPNAIDLA